MDGIAESNTIAGCPVLKYGARGNITKLLQEDRKINCDIVGGINGWNKLLEQ